MWFTGKKASVRRKQIQFSKLTLGQQTKWKGRLNGYNIVRRADNYNFLIILTSLITLLVTLTTLRFSLAQRQQQQQQLQPQQLINFQPVFQQFSTLGTGGQIFNQQQQNFVKPISTLRSNGGPPVESSLTSGQFPRANFGVRPSFGDPINLVNQEEKELEQDDDLALERLTKSCVVHTTSATPEQLNITFHLFTRLNPNEPYLINGSTSKQEILHQSPFNPMKPIKWITHGFHTDLDRSEWMQVTKDKLLKHQDVNVILTDWRKGASPALAFYPKAASNALVVSRMIAKILRRIKDVIDLRQVHLIGHSLGAHIMGFVGSQFASTTDSINLTGQQENFSGQSMKDKGTENNSHQKQMIGRITACDPALPCFGPRNTGATITREPIGAEGNEEEPTMEFVVLDGGATDDSDPNDQAEQLIEVDPSQLSVTSGAERRPAARVWAHLKADSALLVEVMHTNGGLMGYSDPLGHYDFYPNGRGRQPGCEPNQNGLHPPLALPPEMAIVPVPKFVPARLPASLASNSNSLNFNSNRALGLEAPAAVELSSTSGEEFAREPPLAAPVFGQARSLASLPGITTRLAGVASHLVANGRSRRKSTENQARGHRWKPLPTDNENFRERSLQQQNQQQQQQVPLSKWRSLTTGGLTAAKRSTAATRSRKGFSKATSRLSIDQLIIQPLKDLFKISTCSHHRAVDFMVEAMDYGWVPNENKLDQRNVCQMVGYRCANYERFKRGACFRCDHKDDCRTFFMMEENSPLSLSMHDDQHHQATMPGNSDNPTSIGSSGADSPASKDSSNHLHRNWWLYRLPLIGSRLANHYHHRQPHDQHSQSNDINQQQHERATHIDQQANQEATNSLNRKNGPRNSNKYYFNTKPMGSFCLNHYHLFIKYRWFRLQEALANSIIIVGNLANVTTEASSTVTLNRLTSTSFTMLITTSSFLGQIDSMWTAGDQVRPNLIEYVEVTYMSNLDPKIRALGSAKLCLAQRARPESRALFVRCT